MLFVDECAQFKSVHVPSLLPQKEDFLFCYRDNKIGLINGQRVPNAFEVLANRPSKDLYCFGMMNDGRKCFIYDGSSANKLDFVVLRTNCLLLSSPLQNAVVLGSYIHRWRSINRYCGRCGKAMNDSAKERALICTACNNIVYPRISPCVIVLVTDGAKMLLARSPHFPPKIFSTLAGFVDLLETVEQAVVREVKEEVGVNVTDVTYVCSQPWLFPDSLMLGFTAKCVSGDICIDGNEIEAAAWFDRDSLPELPSEMSISRYLIERHLKNFDESLVN